MDLRNFEYFIASTEEQEITSAALRLNISQTSLTRQTKQLEQEFGVSLFIQTSRGAILTDTGECFLTDARKIHYAIIELTKRAPSPCQGNPDQLSIGVFDTGVPSVIPRSFTIEDELYRFGTI